MTTKTRRAKVFKPDGPAGPEETIELKAAMERRAEEKDHDLNVDMPPRNPADNFRAKLRRWREGIDLK